MSTLSQDTAASCGWLSASRWDPACASRVWRSHLLQGRLRGLVTVNMHCLRLTRGNSAPDLIATAAKHSCIMPDPPHDEGATFRVCHTGQPELIRSAVSEVKVSYIVPPSSTPYNLARTSRSLRSIRPGRRRIHGTLVLLSHGLGMSQWNNVHLPSSITSLVARAPSSRVFQLAEISGAYAVARSVACLHVSFSSL